MQPTWCGETGGLVMQQHRTRPDAGWDRPKKDRPTGPNGRRLCRKCSREVPVGRRTFCSDDCVHGWKIETDPGYVRNNIFKRDHGVCSVCGVDTVAIHNEICKLFRQYWSISSHNAFLRWLGIPRSRLFGSLWDADHIVPVVEGGGCCGLENFRTLCIPCHKAATAALRRRLKEQRQSERQKERTDAIPNFA